jgi:hypothetical protein
MKKRMVLIGLGWLCMVWNSPVCGEQINFAAATTAASELEVSLEPRATALGEAFVGMEGSITSMQWNPAGVSSLRGGELTLLHNVYLEDTAVEYLAFAARAWKQIVLGGSFAYWNYGRFEKVDKNFQKIGEFTPYTLIGSMVAAFDLGERMGLGLGIKGYYQAIDSARLATAAMDLGYWAALNEAIRFGIALQNLGYLEGDYKLPLWIRLGGTVALFADSWKNFLEVDVPFADARLLAVGLGSEYTWNKTFALRVGYKYKYRGSLQGVAGLTAGAGFAIPASEGACLSIDYALATYGDLGIIHQIAATMAWGAESQAQKKIQRGAYYLRYLDLEKLAPSQPQ